MIDINALINNAIASAVDARLVPLMETHANVVGELARRIEKLEGQIAAARPQVEFTDKQQDAFVEHINNQEWFWNKINHYVDRYIEAGGYVDRDSLCERVEICVASLEYVTKDNFQELFEEALENADLDDPVREVLRNVSVSLDL